MPKPETAAPPAALATTTPGTLVPRTSADTAGLDELDTILRGGDMNVEVVDDPEIISRQIIEELLSAQDDDALEFVGEAQGWGELEGIPIQIRGFQWRPSTIEGSAIYLVVHGDRMDIGERVVLTTGSLNVVAQLSNIARRGGIPGAIRILKRSDKPTRSGFYPMQLVRLPEEVARARARSTQ